MLKITPLASSSAGNCYHVTDGRTALLLECGLPIRRLRAALREHGLRLADVMTCLVSHEHGDHSRAVEEVQRAGIPVWMSRGTAEALGDNGVGLMVRVVKDQVQVTVGAWTVLPFAVVHDAAEPLGFLLASGDERLLFLTDSAYSPHRFAGLTHIMIECNYSRAALDEAIDDGRTAPQQRRRLLHSHFSLEQVLELLKANDLSRLQETWLLHLSDANSDELEMKRAVQRATGRPVYVCAK
jgi:phosphoribosyl 1,2-cyclic phosphodiesterase